MLFGLLAGILFALDTVILELAMRLPVYSANAEIMALAPYISTFLHYTASAVLLLLYLGGKKQCSAAFAALKTRSGKALLVSAIIGGPVGMSAYTAAIHYIGPGYTTAISAFFPALGALLSYIFLGEHLNRLQTVGLLVSVTGVAILGFSPIAGEKENVALGLVFAFLSCACWAAEGVIISYGMKTTDVTEPQILLVRQTVSAIVCGVVILPLMHGWRHTFSVLPSKATLYISLAALFLTLCYFCYYTAIARVGAAKAMSLNITYSAWALPISFLLLGDIPGVKSVLCSLLVVMGSLISAVERKPKAQ